MRKSWVHILLLVGAIVMIIPFFWMVSTSFKSYLESMQIPPTLFPEQFHFDNYARVFESADFLTYYANTIFVTVARTASQLFLCSMAAYAFARLDFPFKNTLFLVILSVLMVPIQVILIPNYALLSQFGWINTFYALIVPGIFSAFGVFLLRQFFMGIPKELDEAAIMDGCSKWGVYWRIILPNAKPALVALGIFTVLASWNDFMWPLVMTNSADMRVLSVGIANFEGQYSTEYPLLMAAALMSTIPMLLMFLFLQKYLIAGIALGGVRR
ncbi:MULTISPECIES: carbohydrate ABC transporter permease [Shouchella]|uniref:L-arabinose transport system permease protein AraQ n=3 Tax=Bacillaceae TaxID=186817 RepID=A0A060M183_9BACI|nr:MULTISPECIES: carbohydrate ABC transporter permease [Bacillaceae]RQW18791.1 carbohydrate ABC transporter permease [Bacillus sp. C1-1]AIC96177.1 L-arabinose transport system permease protein AraQ [Shouchella lehensis G1]KQL58751.1 sugar ABC transporter permease [Alkalicoccobacillus plakortidis]MBG9785080.1 sugar ABC transporter permease [Shouchella lehensis]TES46510.1 carbohydrate ABC transporter permease [Shouchella lehensis]